MRKLVGWAAWALAVAVAGCGGRELGWERPSAPPAKEKPGAEAPKPAAPDVVAGLEKKALETWAERDQVPELERTIALLKEILAAKGGADYATLVWLSHAYYLLGEIEEAPEKKLEAFDEGARYGDLALDTIPAFRARFEKTRSVEEAAQAVGKGGIDAIYWDAVNVGKWAKVKGITKSLFMKDRVKRMIDRVRDLDERWFFGAADRYLGAYYAALPSFAGRDLELSKLHFEKALPIAPDYLATRTLMAEFYARAANDRALYVRELKRVLETSPDVLPGLAPEQRIARRKAKELLAEVDDYFDAEEAEEAPASAPPAATRGGS